ncbi:hypothetical protein QE374_002608 [Microbacterium sp. SORGH_AS428]|uniref:hypothetical protein n=1 Tax=Microbacterium sp. SORGH_AS_0428 TaxID=3041788 RepID=UPI002856DE17|nr:hypothetical protein [Microbacterium sp. SORGH_AS_0428]MDR6200699.1 hypothetical protein [Microbacterium sp. SORGH_AS_0428]
MTLQMMPENRTPAAGTAETPDVLELRWERIAPERYRALCGEECVGFVDVVGAVFVVLAGARYDRAEEIAQTLDFDRVTELLERSSR